MEAALSRIEAHLIEQNEAIRILNSKVDSALQSLASLFVKFESIVDRLPDGFRSDVGELAAPPRKIRDRLRRRRSLMDIPVELQTDILMRMPVKSILLCKCVCKHFRNIIQNPNFIQTHLTRINPVSNPTQSLVLAFGEGSESPYNQWDHFLVSIDNSTKDVLSSLSLTPPVPLVGHSDLFHFVGSCNGLICVLFWYNDAVKDFFFLLWNPVIKQCRYLPKSPCTRGPDVVEFGYVTETNDYVIVKVNQGPGFYVEVYKMSIDSWIVIECGDDTYLQIYRDTYLQIYRGEACVFLNGSFHWTFTRDDCYYILYYKIKDEKLQVMKAVDGDRVLIPNELNHRYTFDNQWKLAVIDESLALIFWNVHLSDKLEVWVMNEYGVQDSWAIRYQIVNDIFSYLSPVNYWTNGNLLITYECGGFYLFVLNTKRRKKIPDMETNGTMVAFFSFVETLVPVKYGDLIFPFPFFLF